MLMFKSLWKEYPTVKEGDRTPCRNSSGKPNFNYQCAIRLGVALTRNGVNMNSYPRGGRCWFGHKGHTLRAEQLANWLKNQIHDVGKVQVLKNVTYKDVTDSGIVFFKDFWGPRGNRDHIDIWDGTRFPPNTGMLDYFGRSKEVWLWVIK